MPILSDAGVLRSPLGQNTLGSAVAGEFWPIVVISLFLTGAHATTASIVLLFVFGLVVAGAALLAVHFQPPRILSIVRETVNKSGQLAVRLSLATLAVLVLLANELNFDFVLGAFAAGLIIGLVTQGRDRRAGDAADHLDRLRLRSSRSSSSPREWTSTWTGS